MGLTDKSSTRGEDFFKHDPVLLNESLEFLSVNPSGIYVDATLGLGGHAQAICQSLHHDGRVIAFDQDPSALHFAQKRLEQFSARVDYIRDNFRHLKKCLDDLNIIQIDGIIFDVGVSSYQLDDPGRGFSLKSEGPLDMRMNPDSAVCAYDLVNSLTEQEIEKILREYGEERWSRRIARQIIQDRMRAPIKTTKDLRKIVLRAMPMGYNRHQRIHPATRVFQAFRIAVNQELESLEIALHQALDRLKPGGRMVVISFHSLEDRIVKHFFRLKEQEGVVSVLTKKPVRPSEQESTLNPRARSARLRAAEKQK